MAATDRRTQRRNLVIVNRSGGQNSHARRIVVNYSASLYEIYIVTMKELTMPDTNTNIATSCD